MLKVLGSKIPLNDAGGEIASGFLEAVADLLCEDAVLRLLEVSQHLDVTRFQHSLNVAYYSYLVCEKLGIDARAAARGGLLHDLFYYECKEVSLGTKHITFHPEEALLNAEKICDLSDKERNIIKSHMWPLGFTRPKCAEAYVVSFVDKYCATLEFSDSLAKKIVAKSRKLRRNES